MRTLIQQLQKMAQMVCEKIAGNKINVIFDIPEGNTYGYAADTCMKLNTSKMKSLGWKPEIGLEEAYRRMIQSMHNTKQLLNLKTGSDILTEGF